MKITKTNIILILSAIVLFSAVSCQDDKVLYYNNMTMGNVVNGQFVSDQGNIFNVVNQTCVGKLDTMNRAIMICDVLNVTKGAENEYDIRLNQLASVLSKAPVAMEDATGDIAVKNPIHISEFWYSGGYLNFFIQVPRNPEITNAKHLINLAYNLNDDGSYTFELRHNGFGDIYESGNTFSLGGGYVSFPISSIIKADNAKFIIKWNWYESVGYGWTTTEQEYVLEYNWKRNGYEQVPQLYTSSINHL